MVPVFLSLEQKAVLPTKSSAAKGAFHQIPMIELHQGFATFSCSIIQTDLYFPF